MVIGDKIKSLSYWSSLLGIFIFQISLSGFKIGFNFETIAFKQNAPALLVLLILGLFGFLSRNLKNSLVHLKIKNPLPGSQAFSKWIKHDPRINTQKLKEKIGSFPKSPREQNTKWYELYQVVKDKPEIIIAQRKYLLFRDLAILHFFLLMFIGTADLIIFNSFVLILYFFLCSVFFQRLQEIMVLSLSKQLSQFFNISDVRSFMKCLINLFSDDKLNFETDEHGKYSSQSAQVSKLWNTSKLGFHVEILNPKSYSCPYHFHHLEEELFIVLSGYALVRQDEQYYKVSEGDLVVFKTGVAHQFYNHTEKPFKFFALSNKEPNEICEYPDSYKKWDRKAQKLYQKNIEVKDYWLDEENPDLKWPAEIVNNSEESV